MNIKEIVEQVKKFIDDKKVQFKNLKKEKRIAIIVGVLAIILASVFGLIHLKNSKYKVLFSGLDSNDAASITRELESRKVDMKVKGDGIYVPKEEVDRLRLELSNNISNGSKGFEIMDEGSSLGMTDEEFKIKQQRMVQGEIEKTIKTFSQVENARVHITQGEESVFSKESIPGKAAVYIDIKLGEKLEPEKIRSIISLVSGSTKNLPKQNVEVIDQNMNLLSEGLFDENGNVNSSNSSGMDIARNAEKELSKDLERSIVGLLEPIFGIGKVKATVNADLNFDTKEQTELIIDPNKVIVSESKSENKSSEQGNTGGAIDNNMNNTSSSQNGSNENREEKTEYEVGKLETKTIKAQGELNNVTASVAIDGELSNAVIADVEKMVANTIGMKDSRGDSITVVSMKFNPKGIGADEDELISEKDSLSKMMKNVGYIVAGLLILIVIALIAMYIIKKKKEEEDLFNEEDEINLINQKLEEMEQSRLSSVEEDEESMTLEEEVRKYAAGNPDQVTELINSWLNE